MQSYITSAIIIDYKEVGSMILIDKDIKEYVARHELIKSGYDENNLNGMSYDLTIDVALDKNGKQYTEYELKPGEIIFIKTQEELCIPDSILGRIGEKNSRMRQGLVVSGPHYQPGHQTYAFLRVMNISENLITLSRGNKIAQIIFEQLTGRPDVPYSAQTNASFQNEVEYKGLGNYKQEYENQMKHKLDEAKGDIENISSRIYANVLTLMGVLVAVFSLISINYQAFTNANISMQYILVMNLSMTLCIVIMLGLILIFINNAKNKKFIGIYAVVLLILVIAVIALCVSLL